jgi:hypothetical protein
VEIVGGYMLSPSHLSRLINQWQEKKQQLAIIKAEELALRLKLVSEGFDPSVRSGTENLALADGRLLKAKKRLNYSFTSTLDIQRALIQMKDVGPEGELVGQRLVRWSADLVVGEYKKLGELAHGEQYLSLVNDVIVVTDATPELMLK